MTIQRGEQKMSDDLISRRAALSLAKELYVPTADGTAYKHRCIDPDEIRELPSAQGLQECEKCIFKLFKQFQPEQPEIVRCKDCKHYDTHDHRCKVWNHGVIVMGFCHKGERR